MTRYAVLHYMGATQKSLSVVASLVADLRHEGHSVTVVDVGRYNTINQSLPPAWVVRLLGHENRSERFSQVLEAMGVSIHILSFVAKHDPPSGSSRWHECEQSIESELLTYFRKQDLSQSSRSMREMENLLRLNAQSLYDQLRSWLVKHQPDEILIPNGRTSRQKVARVCAEELGITAKFYENGRAKKDSYYLGTTQPHDRVASQDEVPKLTAAMTTEEISRIAQTWLNQRMGSQSGTNVFSKAWSAEERELVQERRTHRAVFFTSSADEFLAFGPMWNIDSWGSQFHAFDLIMDKLSRKGWELILRVHPNLVTKSRAYFKSTVRQIRALQRKHPALHVIWHNSTVNSYDLARSADCVFAERSTIGLEANLMGKPVWITQASQWDSIADVKQLLEPEQVTSDVLKPWRVDPAGGERFVAYWMIQERPLSFSWHDWSSWSPENPPFLLKVALLFSKNPWFHRFHLVKLEFTRIANERFADVRN